MTRNIVSALVVMLLVGGACRHLAAETDRETCLDSRGDREIEDCLVEINAQLFREVLLRGNRAFLDDLSFPETILVVPGGIESRGSGGNQPGLPKVEEIDVRNEAVLLKGESAVLAGTLEMKGTMDSRPIPKKVRYLSVFVKTNEGWRMLARSLAPVMKPGGVP